MINLGDLVSTKLGSEEAKQWLLFVSQNIAAHSRLLQGQPADRRDKFHQNIAVFQRNNYPLRYFWEMPLKADIVIMQNMISTEHFKYPWNNTLKTFQIRFEIILLPDHLVSIMRIMH